MRDDSGLTGTQNRQHEGGAGTMREPLGKSNDSDGNTAATLILTIAALRHCQIEKRLGVWGYRHSMLSGMQAGAAMPTARELHRLTD